MPATPTDRRSSSPAATRPDGESPREGRAVAPAPRLRQVLALARGEAIQLRRNKVALVNCFALPVVTAGFFVSVMPGDAPLRAVVPSVVIGMAILFVVYYTLVTAVVARRESLLLKRLRTGEASDQVILAGICLPFTVVTLLQAVIAVGVSVAVFDGQPGQVGWTALGIALVLLAALLGTIAFAALAVASTAVTKTVEHAQITTLPVILIPILLSGMTVPLAVMPDAMRIVAEVMPLTPIIELTQIGLTGTDVDGQVVSGVAALGAAVRPLLVLLGWTALASWVAARTMRWEPRS